MAERHGCVESQIARSLMATVQQLLAVKGSQEIFSIDQSQSVLDAAKQMNLHQVGALVITDEQERVKGIFTERDVLRRVVVEQQNPASTHVGDVMTTEIACCKMDTTIEEARTVMKNKRIRHLPVVGSDMRLEGMISIGDLNAYDTNNQEVTIQYLHEYIYGRT